MKLIEWILRRTCRGRVAWCIDRNVVVCAFGINCREKCPRFSDLKRQALMESDEIEITVKTQPKYKSVFRRRVERMMRRLGWKGCGVG